MTDEEQVFSYWQEVMQKPRARMDEARRKAIRGRLRDGYSVQDLQDAIRGCRFSRFHMGENDRRKVYNDVSLICRDAAHVDQFVEIYEAHEARRRAETERALPSPSEVRVIAPERLQELRRALKK
jgi:hypothetical protein